MLYETLCAMCHTPSSPAYVGKSVCGASASDIREAISEVPTMQFLKGKLTDAGIRAIASYLKTMNCGDSPERQGGDTNRRTDHKGR